MLKDAIFSEYQKLQGTQFQEVKSRPDSVIEEYKKILKKIEILAEPLNDTLKRVQTHAYRGIGIMYLIQEKSELANRYFEHARVLTRLDGSVFKYYLHQPLAPSQKAGV